MDGYIVFPVGESCSLEQLISRVFGHNDLGQYGLVWLKNNFLSEIFQERIFNINTDRKHVKTNSQLNYIDENELEQYRFYHPYMFERGLDEKVINLFDIGYDNVQQAITFPVRDKEGNCLFIAKRSVNIKWFSYPNDVEKPLYGIYELYQLDTFPKEVYVCESMIDCCLLWKHEKYAVALNGLGTRLQFKQLNDLPCRKLILATDNDTAGQQARIRLKQNIKYKLITEIKLPYGKKDIGECTDEEIENLFEKF